MKDAQEYGGFGSRERFLEVFYRIWCDNKALGLDTGGAVGDALAAEYLTMKYGEYWKEWRRD